MSKITILDDEYELTEGPFGEQLIEGKSLQDFTDSLPPEKIAAMAKRGMQKVAEDPERTKEILEQYEFSDEERKVVEKFLDDSKGGKP